MAPPNKNNNAQNWRGALVAGMGAGKNFWPLLLPPAEAVPGGRWQELSAGETAWRFADEVAQLRAGLAALPHDGTRLILAGHSYGAQHVIALAQRYREENLPLAGVVLLAPALGKWWLAEAGWRMSAWIMQGRRPPDLFLSEAELGQLRQGVLRGYENLLRQNQLPQFFGAMGQGGLGFDLADVAQLNVPVLVVWSEGDRVVLALRSGMPLPVNVTEIRLGQEHGHFLFLREEKIWRKIAGWIDSLKGLKVRFCLTF